MHDMELGRSIVDSGLFDRQGRHAGKVDDLLLVVGEPAADGQFPSPEVAAIITGPFALARNLPRPLRWLARQIYRLFGIPNPQPVLIPWERVTEISVVVHVDVDREEAGVMVLAHAVAQRLIGRIPGA